MSWQMVLAGLVVTGGIAGGACTQASPPPPADTAEQTPALPGIHWTEAELEEAVAPVRAGRRLVPATWPGGAKVAVCLGFDIDNESPSLARGNTAISPLSDREYGALEGLPRILRILDERELPGSFYIPAVSSILAPDMVPAIQRSGRHEIALHGWIHEPVATLDDAAEEERLLTQAIEYFTKLTGTRPVGSRTGGWAMSAYTVAIERKLGLLYDSSMMAMDVPYEIVANGENTGLIELPVTWVQDDAPYFGRDGALPSPELIFNVYRDEFDVAYEEGTLLMLTFHPHVVGRRSRAVHLARLIDYMRSRPGVWFATAQEIAEYVKAQAMSPAASE